MEHQKEPADLLRQVFDYLNLANQALTHYLQDHLEEIEESPMWKELSREGMHPSALVEVLAPFIQEIQKPPEVMMRVVRPEMASVLAFSALASSLLSFGLLGVLGSNIGRTLKSACPDCGADLVVRKVVLYVGSRMLFYQVTAQPFPQALVHLLCIHISPGGGMQERDVKGLADNGGQGQQPLCRLAKAAHPLEDDVLHAEGQCCCGRRAGPYQVPALFCVFWTQRVGVAYQ